MNQCFGALNYLSENKICHRDIKLENIMLQRDGDLTNIKLIDFGLSRDMGAQGTVKSLCSGTPFYIAPEVISRVVTTASDLWSLGVVMYVCVAGKLPFPGHTTDEIFNNVLKKDLKIFQDPKLEHLSHEAKDLLFKLLHRDPTKRLDAKQALEHPWIQNLNNANRLGRDNTNQQGMLGRVSSQIKESLFSKLDKNERAALIKEFESWSDGQNSLLRKMSFMQMATHMTENEI